MAENGSLVIRKLVPGDQGSYHCQYGYTIGLDTTLQIFGVEWNAEADISSDTPLHDEKVSTSSKKKNNTLEAISSSTQIEKPVTAPTTHNNLPKSPKRMHQVVKHETGRKEDKPSNQAQQKWLVIFSVLLTLFLSIIIAIFVLLFIEMYRDKKSKMNNSKLFVIDSST